MLKKYTQSKIELLEDTNRVKLEYDLLYIKVFLLSSISATSSITITKSDYSKNNTIKTNKVIKIKLFSILIFIVPLKGTIQNNFFFGEAMSYLLRNPMFKLMLMYILCFIFMLSMKVY